MSTIAGVQTSGAGLRPMTTARPSGATGPTDSFQGQARELRLQVTPAMLHTTAFQQQLADYSARGIAVQVDLVANLPALAPPPPSAPTPTPAPAPTPASAPTAAPPTENPGPGAKLLSLIDATSQMTGPVGGALGGVALAAGAAVLAGFGGMLLGSVVNGMGVLNQLFSHGPLGAISYAGSSLNLPALVGGGVAAAAAAGGGLKIGNELGGYVGKLFGAVSGALMGATGYMLEVVTGKPSGLLPAVKPQVATPAPTRPTRAVMSQAEKMVTTLVTLPAMMSAGMGGAVAAFALATTGSLIPDGLNAYALITPMAAVAAGIGAAFMGGLGQIGGMEIGRNLDKALR